MIGNINPSNPIFTNLFRPIDPMGQSNFVGKGSLVTFNYTFFVHDPYPLVVVTDVFPGNVMRGVNLHYLTFPYIKALIRSSNPAFSYQNIKGDQYIVNAFRSYKWHGIRQIKKLDSDFILTVMATARSFDPNEIQAIRQSVKDQINMQMNPRASDLSQPPNPQQGVEF